MNVPGHSRPGPAGGRPARGWRPRERASPGSHSCRVPVPVGDASPFSRFLSPVCQAQARGWWPACHECPYTQVHARPGLWRSSPDRSSKKKTETRPCTLRAPALGTGSLPRGPRSPVFRESGPPVCSTPGSRVRPGEGTRRGHRARSAAGRGSQPVPALALCVPAPAVSRARGGGSVSAPTPLPRRAPPLSTLVPGLRPGAVTTPFWLVISSSPRPARPGRTAHLRLGVRPSGLPFLSWLYSRQCIQCLEPHF